MKLTHYVAAGTDPVSISLLEWLGCGEVLERLEVRMIVDDLILRAGLGP